MTPHDLRDPAGRSTGEPITQLRPRVQALAAADDATEMVRHRFGPPQIVVREHANNAVRWKPGERLNHLLEEACIRFADHDAVVAGDVTVSYRDLNRRANQVARHLIAQGIRSGDRVGLIFDRSVETYIAMLAVLKANAAYVPLDAAF